MTTTALGNVVDRPVVSIPTGDILDPNLQAPDASAYGDSGKDGVQAPTRVPNLLEAFRTLMTSVGVHTG